MGLGMRMHKFPRAWCSTALEYSSRLHVVGPRDLAQLKTMQEEPCWIMSLTTGKGSLKLN